MDLNRGLYTSQKLEFTEPEIKKIAHDIEVHGYAKIEHLFQPWVIESANSFIEHRKKEIDSDYITLRSEDMVNTVIDTFKSCPEFINFAEQVRVACNLKEPKDKNIHSVLRSIKGSDFSNKTGANKYHFDAYDLTFSMPLEIPSDEDKKCGDFIFYKRRRSTSKGLLKTLIYKSIFQHTFFQEFIRPSALFRKLFKEERMITKPRNLYVFLGFRTYHGNEELDEGLFRSTALFHYSNPLESSPLIKRLEARRKKPQELKANFN